MKSKLLKSYAKINLSLDILGRNKNNLEYSKYNFFYKLTR